MSALALFASTFVLVFALGLQSLMVNRGHYVGAFVNSLLISAAQLLLLKLGPDAAGAEVAGYIFGGPFGIVCAMYAFRRWNKARRPNETHS
ncbi:MAG: hypothetical protein WBG17_14070 [Burkholderiaceae bacterium]